MMKPSILRAIFLATLFSVTYFIHGQAKPLPNQEKTTSPTIKPFKILTNGNQVTIQSKQDLKSLIVWTASGHRIVEEKAIKATSYSFTIQVKEKLFFLMLQTADGKRYTEKIGVK